MTQITIALRDSAFEVNSFEDPQLALSKFKPNHHDLVILDIRLPHTTGDRLYQKLIKIDGKFKVCILSAS